MAQHARPAASGGRRFKSENDLVIETRELTKIYGEQRSVDGIDLHVRRGRIYGLLGRNGAGKTTTMKMLLGLTPPTAGEANVFGLSMPDHADEVLPRVGSLIESPGFYPNLTGTENLRIIARLRGIPGPDAVMRALEVVGLPYRDKKLFSQYSLGMKQRLAIALAIMHDPELLILDEPINGLDPIGIAEVRAFIKRLSAEQGKTIIVSSHILSEIELLADDIGIIDHGHLLEEESLAELEEKNTRYLRLKVGDTGRAALVLDRHVAAGAYRIMRDGEIRVFDTTLAVEPLVAELVAETVGVREVMLYEATLEDYFKRVTGGEGIA
ncbi:MAG TPA: ABC transporter ATP-binding protein [Candidatus Olsenella avicola]|nr:ABC transporter ATP-binding protein [Candidatus Olsenella avicola]